MNAPSLTTILKKNGYEWKSKFMCCFTLMLAIQGTLFILDKME